jgi:hypothetical protein
VSDHRDPGSPPADPPQRRPGECLPGCAICLGLRDARRRQERPEKVADSVYRRRKP